MARRGSRSWHLLFLVESQAPSAEDASDARGAGSELERDEAQDGACLEGSEDVVLGNIVDTPWSSASGAKASFDPDLDSSPPRPRPGGCCCQDGRLYLHGFCDGQWGGLLAGPLLLTSYSSINYLG